MEDTHSISVTITSDSISPSQIARLTHALCEDMSHRGIDARLAQSPAQPGDKGPGMELINQLLLPTLEALPAAIVADLILNKASLYDIIIAIVKKGSSAITSAIKVHRQRDVQQKNAIVDMVTGESRDKSCGSR